MKNNDELLFAHEDLMISHSRQKPWKVLIADDEEEVHAVTRMVLDNFVFEGRQLALFSAYSGKETKTIMRDHPDMAVVLLDVVMEEENTGLDVVHYIRNHLNNTFVRIVLRTGQPGQAPEQSVTMEYDINDYKEKTELTAQKLFTTMVGLLRAYRDLRIIERQRLGFERIAIASQKLFEFQSLSQFASGVLAQFAFLLNSADDVAAQALSGFVAYRKAHDYTIIAGLGQYEHAANQAIQHILPDTVRTSILDIIQQPSMFFCSEDTYIGHFHTREGADNLIYLHSAAFLDTTTQDLLRVFTANLSVAFENIYLNEAIMETQKEVIFTLGKVVGKRSLDTEEHIQRVAACAYLLAVKAGLDEDDANIIKLASPMHDLGKFGVPDTILSKQSTLTPEEFEIIRNHPIVGYNILKDSKQQLLKSAAIIALQHYERWDGNGYPEGLHGDEIHIFARITNLADALEKCMQTHTEQSAGEFPVAKIRTFLKDESGKQFDPTLVNLALEHLEELLPQCFQQR